MKRNELKELIREHVLDILNETTTGVDTASENFKKWLEKAPSVVQNLQKLRAEKMESGSMWGVFLYDKSNNKMQLVGGLTPSAAKALLKPVQDEIMKMVQEKGGQPPQQPGGMPPAIPGAPPPVPGTAPGMPPMPAGQNTDTTMFMKK